jgi:single-stranded-DNA-specific exonuclease
MDELRLSEPVAITLVRRGYRTPDAALAFLEANESHSPGEFRSMGEVTDRILAAIQARRRITVHGDFDVDGVSATAIMVRALRDLGADCDWLIPDRITDGYGLKSANMERLAQRGTSLIVTVDCGVTAVEEVAVAHALGLEVIVTDHHQPGAGRPECPMLHPALDGYPFSDLCGTAVTWKLACALREASGIGGSADDDLDLVALATVADVVPLIGENRSLVRRGLEEARRARRPGIRALLEVSGTEPATLDEVGLAFRLAPRINAVGRLYRADAGVELFLTEDQARAKEIATELNRANSERRTSERQVEAAAEAAMRELPRQLRDAPGLVLAGQGWHPGVIGIVASRLVEQHQRPIVVVSLDGEGSGRGSGRSIPGFDLLGGLRACADHLVRFGGHRAAAGLELREESLDAFREGFAAHAAEMLKPGDLRRTEQIDAMIGGAGMGLDLAEELERLAPFGMGNPKVRFLVPSAQVRDVEAMGNGRHSRFSLHSGSHRALGVAFGRSTLGVAEDEPVDIGVRLELNQWNGSVEPRVVLRELYPLEMAETSLHACDCPDGEWWQRFEAELSLDLGTGDSRSPGGSKAQGARGAGRRETVQAAGSPASVIAELLSSGAGVLALCADASRHAALAGGAAGLARFNGGVAGIACSRCPGDAAAGLLKRAASGLALTDYTVLEAEPTLPEAFEHVVLVDPPASATQLRLVTYAGCGKTEGGGHHGYLHTAWGERGVRFAESVLAEHWPQRAELIATYRDLRDANGGLAEEEGWLRRALEGLGPHPRGPEVAARCFRVLTELGLLEGAPDGGSGTVGVVSSEETTLERSIAFRAYSARYQGCRKFLERQKQP